MGWIKRLSDCPWVARLCKYHGPIHNPEQTVVVAVSGHSDYDDDWNKQVYRIEPRTSRKQKPEYHLDFVITANCTVYKYKFRRLRCKWTWERFAHQLRDKYGQDVVRQIREAFGDDGHDPCGKKA